MQRLYAGGGYRIVLAGASPEVADVVSKALRRRFVVVVIPEYDRALRTIARDDFHALVLDGPRHVTLALTQLVRARRPSLPVLSLSEHVLPNLATLLSVRPTLWGLGLAAPRDARVLLDALVASVDDPRLDGPHTN
ncbi:MAG: hypothetical protein KC543_11120 [Myxococcales bacterium]|nr:hypothetical protein [Myxococcales bacterium]